MHLPCRSRKFLDFRCTLCTWFRVHFVTPKIISFASRSAAVSNLLRVLSIAGSATDFHSFVHGFEEPPSVGYLLVGVYRAAQVVQQRHCVEPPASPCRRWCRRSPSDCLFTSVVFLEGPAKYLFTPLGLAVVFAMLAPRLRLSLPDDWASSVSVALLALCCQRR